MASGGPKKTKVVDDDKETVEEMPMYRNTLIKLHCKRRDKTTK